MGFRTATWLPHKPPALPVRRIEIVESAPGQWSGDCTGANIYSVAWPLDCIAPPYRPLMEQQAIVHLSGGVSEAIHRGARRSEVLAFAKADCCIEGDLRRR
jgi:hypothetical protein